MLPAPGFHHLHLNSGDPDAAIDFYVRQFPTSAKASWGGLPAFAAPNDVRTEITVVGAHAGSSPVGRARPRAVHPRREGPGSRLTRDVRLN